MVGGTLLSAGAQYSAAGVYESQAELIRRNAAIQSAITNMNADLSDWEAGSYARIGKINRAASEGDALAVERATLREVRRFRRGFGRLQKTQVATYASAGFAPDPGLGEILDEGAELFEEDLAALMEEGALEASRIRLTGKASEMSSSLMAAQSLSQAALGRLGAKQIILAGKYGAASAGYQADAARWGSVASLLSGAGNIAMQYYRVPTSGPSTASVPKTGSGFKVSSRPGAFGTQYPV
ncbi:MAG: hypothetical protein K9K33_09645 [Desulfarculaceae bacterium]|nr:hypothetical protein [Desulfarculaceae bacterium]